MSRSAGVPGYLRQGLVAGALGLAMALAGCTGSSPVTTTSSSGNGGTSSSPGTSGSGGAGTGPTTPGGDMPSAPAASNSIFLNIVPPGSNGNSAGGLGVQNDLPISYPPNFKDQATLYGDLTYAESPLEANPCTPPTSLSQHTAASDLACDYFKHEGLTPDTVASTETIKAPSGDTVTIKRDGWGVPFISAKTREDAMYGVGYANGEDRLWLDDVLRRVGRGMVTAFLGAAPGISSFDANLAVTAGYSNQELNNMITATAQQLGPAGQLFLADANSFVGGLNAYIKTLSGKNAAKMPPEYASLRLPDVPVAATAIQPFTVADIVGSAILIQSLFATGGGGEDVNELLLQKLDPNFTAGVTTIPAKVCGLWRDLRHANDPDAPVTIDTPFYESPAKLDETCPQAVPAGNAIWDVGSFKSRSPLQIGNLSIPAVLGNVPGLLKTLLPGLSGLFPAPSAPQASLATPRLASDFRGVSPSDVPTPLVEAGSKSRWIAAATNPLQGMKQALRASGVAIPNTTSNWIAVNADQTVDGHPIAVMGPQTSYFTPELLWEFAVHSDEGWNGNPQLAVDGRGIATAMLPYIEIGRGANYAWSATSGEGDLVDTFVSKMCNTDGSTPSLTLGANGFPEADGYLYGGQCRKFYEREDTWTALPSVAAIALGGSPVPQTVHRYIMRTHYGPVIATATVGGQPVAISQERSTFYNEISTAIPFALADTKLVSGPKAFQHIFSGVTGTFNWLYVDSQHVAYIQSGLDPERAPNINPDLPVWGNGSYDWLGDRAYLATHPDYFKDHGGFDPATEPTGKDPGASMAYPSRLQITPDGNILQTGTVTFDNYLPAASHPQAIDPKRGYIDSWNNKPAPGWWAPDDNGSWGPTHRVAMLGKRLAAFQASGKKFNFANMVNIMSDAAYTDLRGQAVLPLLLQVMQSNPPGSQPLTADQQKAVTLMQNWLDGAPDGKPNPSDSSSWIGGPDDKDLGAFRRDTNPADAGKAAKSRVYDQQAAVVLMDAWYPQLAKTMLPQVEAIDSCNPATGGDGATAAASNDEGTGGGASDYGFSLQGCYDAPRAQGSAFQSGWFEIMVRVLRMSLGTANHPYQVLKCGGADGGSLAVCRTAVLTALGTAVNTLGGWDNQANWNGTQLPSAQFGSTTGHTVEDYDSIIFTDFSLLGVPNMPWENRPTFQQVVEVR
ncbi:MAG TPA: penicillin acylase family protein [Nevskiaceae bacterium]|nr:penicillin acylase family protein [Nevskiaceae bacterium]